MKSENKQNSVRKLVLTAMFAALTCVATMIIKIPIPATNGYINIGDCIVLMSGWLLGGVYGTASARSAVCRPTSFKVWAGSSFRCLSWSLSRTIGSCSVFIKPNTVNKHKRGAVSKCFETAPFLQICS